MSEMDEQLQQRLAEVEARETDLAKREAAFAAKGLRHNLYDRINVSVKTIDTIIIACVVAIALVIVLGMYWGRS